MPSPQSKPRRSPPVVPWQPVSSLESLRYTSDLLESLRRIALQQGQGMLAHLLELAQVEAKLVARDLMRTQTPLDGGPLDGEPLDGAPPDP